MMAPNFTDDRHALYVGWVIGIAQRQGIEAVPVADEAGNYTDRILVRLPSTGRGTVTLTLVVPPPPPEWTL
jgi:hypothetical protein